MSYECGVDIVALESALSLLAVLWVPRVDPPAVKADRVDGAAGLDAEAWRSGVCRTFRSDTRKRGIGVGLVVPTCVL